VKYQVGKIHDLKDDDPVFDSLSEAYDYALKQERGEPPGYLGQVFWGVWTDQDSGGELLAIVFQGEVFTR
jgi:hypothetical protein